MHFWIIQREISLRSYNISYVKKKQLQVKKIYFNSVNSHEDNYMCVRACITCLWSLELWIDWDNGDSHSNLIQSFWLWDISAKCTMYIPGLGMTVCSTAFIFWIRKWLTIGILVASMMVQTSNRRWCSRMGIAHWRWWGRLKASDTTKNVASLFSL